MAFFLPFFTHPPTPSHCIIIINTHPPLYHYYQGSPLRPFIWGEEGRSWPSSCPSSSNCSLCHRSNERAHIMRQYTGGSRHCSLCQRSKWRAQGTCYETVHRRVKTLLPSCDNNQPRDEELENNYLHHINNNIIYNNHSHNNHNDNNNNDLNQR